MSALVAVRLIGPAPRSVPSLGIEVAATGDVIRVSVDVAGSPPSDDGAGSGLLAQPDIWVPDTATEEG